MISQYIKYPHIGSLLASNATAAKFIQGTKASLPQIHRTSPSHCRSSRSCCPGIAAGLWKVDGAWPWLPWGASSLSQQQQHLRLPVMNRWIDEHFGSFGAVLQFVNACCFDIAVEYCCNMAEFSCTLRIRRGMMLAPTSHRHQGNQQTKWLNYVRRSLSWRQVEAPRSFEFDDVWQVQGFLVWAVLEALWPREVPTTAVRCKDFDMYYDAYRHL